MKTRLFSSCVAYGLLASLSAWGQTESEPTRDYMIIVGSTTIAPFSTEVVDHFVETTGLEKPMVQATGSGGGLMLFCAGVGPMDADITYSSRPIRNSEFKNCQKNGVTEIVQVKIGYDGIVLGAPKAAEPMAVSVRDIYLALAKEVPNPDGSETLVANPYAMWNDVNPSLPTRAIEVYGPPRGSGTRTIFSNLTLLDGCNTFDWMRAMKQEDAFEHRTKCRTLREDGAYIEASENDALTLQKLAQNPDALAIFSFAVLDQNPDKVDALIIDGVDPEFASIADGSYPMARPLYLYVKKAHVDRFPGIREFLNEFTSEDAWGDGGYLSEHGLVPMRTEERRKYAERAKTLSPMTR